MSLDGIGATNVDFFFQVEFQQKKASRIPLRQGGVAIGLEHFWGILAVIRNSLCDRETLHLSFAWLFMRKQWIPSHKTTVLKRPWQDVERNKQTSFEYTYLETSLMFKYLIIINFHVMYLYTPINLNQNPNYYTLSNLNLSQYIGMISYKQMLIKF